MTAIQNSQVNTQGYVSSKGVTNSVRTNSSDTSVFTSTENNSQNQTTELTKKQILENLCKDKLGVSVSEIFNISLENLSDEKIQELTNLINLAIKNATENNKLNKDLAIQMAKNYNVLLNSGCSKETLENREKLERFCQQKLGVTFTEVFRFPTNKLTNENIENLIKTIDFALQQANKNKITDKKAIVDLARKYCVAVTGGYTLDELKKNPNTLNGESINQRMERFFGVKDFSSLSDAKKSELIERYFNGYFEELLKKAKAEGKSIESVYRLQMRDFTKLLANTPDEEKAIFKKAIASLISENRLKGVFLTFASFETQESATKFADSYTTEEKVDLNKVDQMGNQPTEEDVAAMQALIISHNSEDGLKTAHKDLYEKVLVVLEKVKNGEELTENEQALLDAYKQLHAGEIIGLENNKNISTENKQIIQIQWNKDIKSYGDENCEDILRKISLAIDKHGKDLNIDKNSFSETMDSITSNKYSNVIEQTSVSSSSTYSLGFKQGNEADVIKAQIYIDTFRQQQELSLKKADEKIRLEIKERELDRKIDNDINNLANSSKTGIFFRKAKFLKMSKTERQNYLIDLYTKNTNFRKVLVDYIKRSSNQIAILKRLPDSIKMNVAKELIDEGKLTEQDIENLNLDFDKVQELKEKYAKHQEKQEKKDTVETK